MRSAAEIAEIQRRAREGSHEHGDAARPRWPMIVLRTPKGWTGPKVVDGLPAEGSFRSHQVPLSDLAGNPEHLRQLEEWLASYRPEELFDEDGALRAELAALAPKGERRMGANPHANGGVLLRELELPDFRDYAVEVPAPTASVSEPTRVLGSVPARRDQRQPRELPHHGPRRDGVQPPRRRVRGHQPRMGGRAAGDRRSPRAGRAGDGGALRAPLPGLAGGLSADWPSRPVQLLRGVYSHHRLDVQPARQVAEGHPRDPLASTGGVAELPAVLACVAPGPQRVLPPGPRVHRPRRSTRRPRSCAFTSRRTPTACCRSPTTACAAATTST